MEKRFHWEKIDQGFLRKVIAESDRPDLQERAQRCDEEDVERLAGIMNVICPFPNRNFILRHRSTIEQGLLRNYPEVLKDLFKWLKISRGSMNEKLAQMYAKPAGAMLTDAYAKAMVKISGYNVPMTELTRFRYIVSVDMANTPVEEVPLYDFQKDAQAAMRKCFLDENGEAGLLVMPTGSGKSRTATTFLISEMISRGYQILWIAHRHMLIDQAADCFEKFAGLVKMVNPEQKKYRISCISGEHQSIKQVGDSEIIVASISSLYRSKQHLKRVLKQKVCIVVDEAHHTVAPTYDDVIHFVKKQKKDVKLLGLTATPVKMAERDTKYLMRLYNENIIYSVPMSNLISSGILSDPHFKKIETLQDFEPQITADEEKLLRHYGELPQTLAGKIAASHARNAVITREYYDHAAEYGKTLIFALNQMHCRFLMEELRANGVRADGVWSGRENNSVIIDRFKRGELDVLINVNIMTEGTDVPDIQTVFLTRPTQSEGFLMQMIGRGMRGAQANGTETVNIVDFHDKWEVFNRWLDPQWIMEGEEENERHSMISASGGYQEIEWALCRDAYRSLVFQHYDTQETVSIPCAWISLVDEEGQLTRMLVFDNQMDGVKAMLSDQVEIQKAGTMPANVLREKYFPEMGYRPSLRDVELLAENIRTREEPPKLFEISGRRAIEPAFVVEQAAERGEDVFSYAAEVFDENPVAGDLFGDKNSYVMAVCRAKVYANQMPVGSKVEELPFELIPFSREPHYDIHILANEVVNEMFGGSYDGISSIEWTKKVYRSYYGIFYRDDNSIRINCILNSKDVSKEVVKFVLYHEFLHRDIFGHGPEFRRREQLYPNFEECEHFLYDHMHQCDIKEW